MANSAANDTASVTEDSIVAINVLANDGGGSKQLYSLNQGNLQLQTAADVWVTLPSGARVRFHNNLVEYDAAALDHVAAGALLTDTFSYSIKFSNGAVSSANVAVTVTGLNDAPVAVPDAAGGSENQILTINVLANDSDADDGAVLTLTAVSGPAGKGSVSIVGNQLRFDPGTAFDHLAQGATEQVVLSYTVTDEKGATSSSTATITVTGTNDTPVAAPDTAAGTENQVLTINALGNDTDVDDGAVKTLVTASTPVGKGSASIVGGQIQFTPGTDFDHLAQGASEIVVLSYTMKDQQGATSSSFVTITVTGTNDVPVANLDSATTPENSSVSINVLANDTDADDGRNLTVTAASAPIGQGSASIAGNQVLFNPGTDFDALAVGESANVIVNYSIQDERGAPSSSTLTITVTGTNDAPVANPDTAAGTENQLLIIDALANDTDIDHGAVKTLASVAAPAGKGTASIVGNQIQFNPSSDFDHLAQGASEQVILSYSVTDQQGATSTSMVTVTVTGTNDGPVANSDSATTAENSSVSVNVLANDTDVDDGHTLTVTAASAPIGQGSASIVGNQVLFSPGADFDALAVGESANVVVNYSIQDEHGATSSSAVTITVTGANDAPVANPDTAAGTENQLLVIDALANDSDIDHGAVKTLASVAAPAGKGTASIVGNQIQFNPGNGFDHLAQGATEQVLLPYTIADEQGATSSSTITVTVTGTNDGPVANSDVATTTENGLVAIDALANDTDLDDGAIKELVAVAAPPDKGSVAIVGNQVVFNPGTAFDHLAQGANETVVLSYTMQDEHGATSTSTITLSVTGTNDGPVANADTAAVAENGSVTINVLGNDTDADDGAVLTLTAASTPPGQGSVGVVGNQVEYSAGSAFDYLAAGETANVVVSYEIQDEHGVGAGSTATITVSGTNDAPTIDAGNTAATATITELPNGDPGEGTTIHEADGVVAFDDVDLSDLHSASATAQSAGYLGTLILDPVNQDDNSISWHFDVSDADLDGLQAGEHVTQTYTVTVSDGHGGTATQDVTITLDGAAENRSPQALADSAATSEDVSVTINVLANDVDPDGDILTTEIVAGPSHGTITLDALTGSYLYRPAADFNGDDLFTYRVSDTSGAQSGIVAVSVTVVSVNDPPLLTQIIGDQVGHVLQLVSVTLAANLIVDNDGSGNIVYSAELADGAPLPAWLSFDPATATLSGTPGAADADHYSIRVTGAEQDGQTASTSFILTIIDGDAIDGTANGETIDGTLHGDVIRALDGNDTVNAGAGADLVDGGAGDDMLNGQAGDDVLQGGAGRDELRGGDHEDLLFGGAGNDFLYGGSGNDSLDGGDGDDWLEDRDGGSNTLLGGAGNDHLELFTFYGSQIGDAGSGDDVIVVFARLSPVAVTTGEGSDRIHVLLPSFFNVGGIITVTDFTPGPGGDNFSLVAENPNDASLLNSLSTWDGSSNPFNSGFLRLVQSGTDTLFQWDQDAAGSNSTWTTVAVLQNTNVSDFTAENFAPYPPDGSPPPGQTILGTNNGETLTGSLGGDTISALDGNDTVNAGPGADLVNGGAGDDMLNGEAGEDVLQGAAGRDELRGGAHDDLLFGGDGNDFLYGGDGNDSLDGGDGDDWLEDRDGGSNTFLGGAGNDHLELFAYYASQTGDAGSGDDVIVVFSRLSSVTLTTGEGSDRIHVLLPNAFNVGSVITVTDFTPGPGGDNFSLIAENPNDASLLNSLSTWDGSSNPFSSGFLRLVQSGADTLFQWDQDGLGSNATWSTLAVFQNTNAGDFTDANFAPGYDPKPADGASSFSAVVNADDMLLSISATEAMPAPTGTWFDSGETEGFTDHVGQLDMSRMLLTADIL
jgi:VCBS repeat-containing protein